MNYVIIYNGIDGKPSIDHFYENITGKNPRVALKKRFKKKFSILIGSAGVNADVILEIGFYNEETGIIEYSGVNERLCYKLIRRNKENFIKRFIKKLLN